MRTAAGGGVNVHGAARPARRGRIVLVVAVGALAALCLASCRGTLPERPARVERIRLAWSPWESTALLWIALDKGFFAANGVRLDLRRYDTGAATIDAVSQGDADVCVGVTEFPFVARALLGEPVKTLASISRSEFIYVVGRKDRGIERPSDLRGKRVGTTFGTVAQFHLARFLALNGVDAGDVTFVDLKTPKEWVEAVAEGEVDAVATAQPYASAAKARLGSNAVWWSGQSVQPLFAMAVASDDWIAENPALVESFLRALAQAEEYRVTYPAESKAIVARRLGLEPAYMEQVWRQNEFVLSLDQALVTTMEDEARWMITSKVSTATRVPDFGRFIYADGLRTVKPDVVTVAP